MRHNLARRRTALGDMHPHEAPERTVMADEGIGDRTDHPAGVGATA
jgi:hypothetical protein